MFEEIEIIMTWKVSRIKLQQYNGIVYQLVLIEQENQYQNQKEIFQ